MLDDTPDSLAAERNRALLSASARALKARLAPEVLLVDALALSARGLGRVAVRAGAKARAKPVAAALVVAGAAWMMLPARRSPAPAPTDGAALAGTKYEALSRWADEGGPPPPEDEMPDPTAGDDWRHAADAAESRAQAALAALDAAARDALRPAAEVARERAAIVAQRTADLAASFRTGLTGLSQAAQDRAVAARQAAYAARDLPAQALRAAADRPALAVGAALLAGAALATLRRR